MILILVGIVVFIFWPDSRSVILILGGLTIGGMLLNLAQKGRVWPP